ncbi:hypothetical protein F4604DRAFT_1899087 [Suillus subluteus]|nr:hypothetical protein F4604DRAFT_1899087 [Suillus subluteus]
MSASLVLFLYASGLILMFPMPSYLLKRSNHLVPVYTVHPFRIDPASQSRAEMRVPYKMRSQLLRRLLPVKFKQGVINDGKAYLPERRATLVTGRPDGKVDTALSVQGPSVSDQFCRCSPPDFFCKVGDDTYQTWYKIVGDLASGAHPLVVLHGGPGISHEYMTPLAEIHNKCNIPVIFYDQIGIGKSIFKESFGQSICSWRALSMALWGESTGQLLDAMPADVGETIEKHEKEGTTASPEYQRVVGIFYEKRVCKTPWPKESETSSAAMLQNPTVYHTMVGPSEFTVTGTLKSWHVCNPHVKWAQLSQPSYAILAEGPGKILLSGS